MDNNTFENKLMALLAAHPEGLTSKDIRSRLRPKISQPTLSRRLTGLRTRGLVAQTGSARATRYLFVGGRHRLLELRSQAMHQRIAEKLLANPQIIKDALRTLAAMRQQHPAGRPYHDHWERLLRGDRIRLLQMLTADTEEARALRQESPFAGALKPEERLRILERFKAA